MLWFQKFCSKFGEIVKRINNCMTATIEIFYKGHFGNQKQTGVESFETNQYDFIMYYSIFWRE